MFFADLLQKKLKEEKNAINRMYLNEINIKWRKFESATSELDDENRIAKITDAINDFTAFINTPKFKSKNSKGGFKNDSRMFSSLYLHDLLTILVKDLPIFNSSGVRWGYQQFNLKMKLIPEKFHDAGKDHSLELKYSPDFLSLIQKIDIQYRMKGKRNFNKYRLDYPMIVFATHKNFKQSDQLYLEFYANQIKRSFEESRVFVVAETLDNHFHLSLKDSPIDKVFILRKDHAGRKKTKPIAASVIKLLQESINDVFAISAIGRNELKDKGVFESK